MNSSLLPPTDPYEWSDHGTGMGPLDGLEDWGEPWAGYYLSVEVTGAGSDAKWRVRTSWNVDPTTPVVASGTAESVKSAGLAAVEALSNLLNI